MTVRMQARSSCLVLSHRYLPHMHHITLPRDIDQQHAALGLIEAPCICRVTTNVYRGLTRKRSLYNPDGQVLYACTSP